MRTGRVQLFYPLICTCRVSCCAAPGILSCSLPAAVRLCAASHFRCNRLTSSPGPKRRDRLPSWPRWIVLRTPPSDKRPPMAGTRLCYLIILFFHIICLKNMLFNQSHYTTYSYHMSKNNFRTYKCTSYLFALCLFFLFVHLSIVHLAIDLSVHPRICSLIHLVICLTFFYYSSDRSNIFFIYILTIPGIGH